MQQKPVMTPRSQRGRWSHLVRNVALAFATVVLTLLACELLLRLLGITYPVLVWTDPVRGVAHIPNVHFLDRKGGRQEPVLIDINSDGWRGPEVARQHRGVFRIALLGDSFIEAFEVPYEATVGEVLERRLSALWGSPVEVLNFGHGGYGTTQELLTLKHEVWKYSPDLVLLAVTTGNDISDNSRVLKRADYVPYYVYRGSELVLDTTFLASPGYRSRALWSKRMLTVVQHSRLAQLVNRVRHLARRGKYEAENAGAVPSNELGLRDEVHLPPVNAEWQNAWRVTEGLLGMMREECRAHQTPFALVTLTRGIQVTIVPGKKERFLKELGARDLYYAERRLAELGSREGFPVYNLAPIMAVQAQTRQVYFHAEDGVLGVGHWNREGHRVAGKLIAQWLAQELSPGNRATAARGTP